MIGYFLAIIPFYIFVYLPISQVIRGPVNSPSETPFPFNDTLLVDEAVSCPAHGFNTYILSREPLVIYISSFISDGEADHLLEIRYAGIANSRAAAPPFPL
jgi:prolyl 4-hydroxylase